ncbi:MAG: cyclic nucleotide-binding domain-containing protein [Rhodoferax sp.]|nr:cyclic nucleotide-binding domain-containing protein [Rhodoferax sp.]
MTDSVPLLPPSDVSGLVSATSRNSGESGLGRFLEGYRWRVLAGFVRPRLLQRGHLLIAQGDRDRTLYFLESGSLKVDIRTEGGLLQLALLGPGGVVGEGSFFSKLARTASVSAYSDCKVWEMTPQDFDKLTHHHPTVALALSMALGAVMASRMLDLSNRIAVT